LVLLPDFLSQRQSEIRESREAHTRVKSMTAAQKTINCRINALEARQREFSAQHSAIKAELSEVRKSANQTERELSELVTEIRTVSSTSAIAREMLCRRADERLTRSEKGSIGLSADVEALRRGCEEAHEKIAADKDDFSKIKEDLKQLKDRVVQQQPVPTPQQAALPPPTPALAFDSLIVPQFPPLFEEFRAKRFNLLWRGSRDGFTAQEFHRRCDGRANTLTLISDTDGNVFGGFTP
jgi:archaellum component FlaC